MSTQSPLVRSPLSHSLPLTVLLVVALLAAVLAPGAPLLGGCVVAAGLAHRLLARHSVHRIRWSRAVPAEVPAAPAVAG